LKKGVEFPKDSGAKKGEGRRTKKPKPFIFFNLGKKKKEKGCRTVKPAPFLVGKRTELIPTEMRLPDCRARRGGKTKGNC